MADTLREVLDFATDAAWQAGRITLQYFQTGVEVEEKADESPVTAADKGAETKLRELIEARFPDDGIVGEEHGDKKGTTGRRWILDPIDGTKSFVHGVPLYGVLIGVEVEDKPAVGVVHFPALNEMICAASGLGCTWNGRPTRVSDISDIQDATVILTDFVNGHGRGRSHGPDLLTRQTRARLGRLLWSHARRNWTCRNHARPHYERMGLCRTRAHPERSGRHIHDVEWRGNNLGQRSREYKRGII